MVQVLRGDGQQRGGMRDRPTAGNRPGVWPPHLHAGHHDGCCQCAACRRAMTQGPGASQAPSLTCKPTIKPLPDLTLVLSMPDTKLLLQIPAMQRGVVARERHQQPATHLLTVYCMSDGKGAAECHV